MTDTVRTDLGLEPKIQHTLCYAMGWVTGGLFLWAEKQEAASRFHAAQSVAVFLPANLAVLLFVGLAFLGGSVTPVLGWIAWGLAGLIQAASIVLWIILIVQTWSGETMRLGWASGLVERILKAVKPRHA